MTTLRDEMKKHYVIYDGRAVFDTDDAAIYQSCGHRMTRSDFNLWKNTDAVLVEYDEDERAKPPQLINERVIGPLSMGWKRLQAVTIEKR